MNTDKGSIAALAHIQHGFLCDVLHEPDATRAQNTPIGDVEDVAAEVFHRVETLGVWGVPRVRLPLLEDVVLQLTLPRLVADRTVERVIDQQELQDGLPCIERFVAKHLHHLTLGHFGRAGDLQLRSAFDFHQTHAAHARDGQAGMVAIMRDQHPGLLGRLNHQRPLGNGDLDPLDRGCDQRLIRHRLPHHRHRRLPGTDDIRLEFRAELLDPADDRRGAGVAQDTDRLSGHLVGEV